MVAVLFYNIQNVKTVLIIIELNSAMGWTAIFDTIGRGVEPRVKIFTPTKSFFLKRTKYPFVTRLDINSLEKIQCIPSIEQNTHALQLQTSFVRTTYYSFVRMANVYSLLRTIIPPLE